MCEIPYFILHVTLSKPLDPYYKLNERIFLDSIIHIHLTLLKTTLKKTPHDDQPPLLN